MATKPATPAQRWVLLEFQYQKFVMPMEEGMTLFEAMTSMEPIEYSYDEKLWKPKKPSQDDLPHAAAYLLQCDGAIPICLRNRRGGSCLGEKCMCGHSFDGNFHGTTQPYYLKKKDLGKNC